MEPALKGRPHRGPRSLLCLVTPGRGPVPAVTPPLQRAERVMSLVRAAVEAGIDLVQIREGDLPIRLLLDLVREAVRAARTTAARIVVNDRLDVALAAAADGVHLGSASIPAARVREIAPRGFIVGRSVHSAEEAAAGGGDADYVIAGTVFRSLSKPADTPLLGTAGLSAIVQVARVPVLAIGGVDLLSAPAVAATGASGIAAIGLFRDAESGMSAVVAELRRVFDSAGGVGRSDVPENGFGGVFRT